MAKNPLELIGFERIRRMIQVIQNIRRSLRINVDADATLRFL
jgi:hypothetical protein